MTQFEKHVKRCSEKLRRFGFNEYAQRITAKGEAELSKKDEIRSRQELISDGQKFMAAYRQISLNNYTDVQDMYKKANDLLERLSKFERSLGNDAKKLHGQLDECVLKLTAAKNRIQQDMENVWEDLANAQTIEDIESVLSCIALVMNYRIPTRDLQDFEDLQETLNAFMADVNKLQAAVQNREQLQAVIHELRTKYSDSELDFDVISVLEDVITNAEKEIAEKEAAWRKEYLTLGDRTRASIHSWKDNTRVLPAFLSPETVAMVEKLRIEADQIISKAMIDDVLFYFNKLTEEEKKHCLEILLHR